MRVLVVDDHAEMAETVAVGLRRAQMAVDVALDGLTALDRALFNDYDVIVLDRDLPGLHGDEVCTRLVAAGCRSRVLMLTAAAEPEDLVEGLGLGADDYLGKPFDLPVLSTAAPAAAAFRRFMSPAGAVEDETLATPGEPLVPQPAARRGGSHCVVAVPNASSGA